MLLSFQVSGIFFPELIFFLNLKIKIFSAGKETVQVSGLQASDQPASVGKSRL